MNKIQQEALFSSSQKYRETGQISKSNNVLRKILEINPLNVEAFFWLSNQEDLSKDSSLLNNLDLCLQRKAYLSDNDSSYLYFALARVREYQSRYNEAFDLYHLANQFRKKSLNLFNTDSRIYLGQARLHKSLFVSLRKFPNYVLGSTGGDDLTFIIGLPRCGSTLVEAILSMAEETNCLGETGTLQKVIYDLNILKHLESDIFSKKIFQEKMFLINAAYRKEIGRTDFIKIDKTLSNFYLVGLISRVWPAAKIIHVQRQPLDQLLSAWKSRFQKGHTYTLELEDLVKVYIAYKDLMGFWNKELGSKIYTCKYEELVRNPLAKTKELAQHCGLQWTEKMLYPQYSKLSIKTASYKQVREPINDNSINNWRNYETKLKPYIQALVNEGIIDLQSI